MPQAGEMDRAGATPAGVGFLADIAASGSLLVESKDIAGPPRGSGSRTFPALARSDTTSTSAEAMPCRMARAVKAGQCRHGETWWVRSAMRDRF